MSTTLLPTLNITDVTSKGIISRLNFESKELEYAVKVFESKNLHLMENVTYEIVSNIGRNQFNNLNERLKEFTSKISNIKSPGIFSLVDVLQKNVNSADLEGIWNKTVTAKPTTWAKIKSFVNPQAVNESLNNQYLKIYEMLTERSKGLEVKIAECEKQLLRQQQDQENNLKDLSKSYDMYFQSFNELKQEYLLSCFIEKHYEESLITFKSNNQLESLDIKKQLADYESSLSDIVNKRLLLETALLKLPLTVLQNTQLIGTCKNILKEIDSVRMSSFPTIRQNLASLAIALNAQQGLMGSESIKLLELNSSKLNLKVTESLSVEAERMSSQNRLKDANHIREFVEGVKQMQENINRAKEESSETIKQVEQILIEAANELKSLNKG